VAEGGTEKFTEEEGQTEYIPREFNERKKLFIYQDEGTVETSNTPPYAHLALLVIYSGL
jgi:hypothetical protein